MDTDPVVIVSNEIHTDTKEEEEKTEKTKNVIIPKRIFQTWKEKTVTNKILKSWQQTWIDFNPTFSYELWDDDDNRAFVKDFFPEMLETFDKYERNICRADAIRYMYLYRHGGIYADLDFMCLKSFEPFINEMEEKNMDIVLGTLGEMDNANEKCHDLPNALMISRKGAAFWKFVITALIKTVTITLSPETQTGPVFLKLCLDAYIHKNYNSEVIKAIYGADIFNQEDVDFSSNICVSEPFVFYPINWGNRNHLKYTQRIHELEELKVLFPKSMAVTFWMHSW